MTAVGSARPEQAGVVADRFYAAFARRDAEAMAACYADDAAFSDPAFPALRGEQVRDMWRMLVARGKDLRVEHQVVESTSDGARCRVRWQAWYSFSGTGRRVHNSIEARITVKDGRIVEHRDDFDFHAWARQALGAPGLLLGWTPMLKRKVQAQAAKALEKFRAERGGR
jgi:ketosteroid isomerase-like protein